MSLFTWILFEGMRVDLNDKCPRKGYQILWMDKNSKLNNRNAFYPAKEFDTLSTIFFLGIENGFYHRQIHLRTKPFLYSKKQCNYYPSAKRQ